MGKYTLLQTDVFSVFATSQWQNEAIKTFPSDFIVENGSDEYIKIAVIANGGSLNRASVSGQLMVEVYYPSGKGPKRGNYIADCLDNYLVNKTITGSLGKVTQFANSAFTSGRPDKDTPALSKALYTIPFNFYGVTT